MARSVLVLGGTRFFGRRLVEFYARRGERVVVATRGNRETPDVDGVEFVRTVRREPDDLRAALQHGPFDVVHDQLGFQPIDLSMLVSAIESTHAESPRLVFTSSGAVYTAKSGVAHELSEFRPDEVEIESVDPKRTDLDYGAGKRACEVIATHSRVPVASLRIPVVVGADDPTGRLDDVCREAIETGRISVSNPDRDLSLVSSSDAARALAWLGDSSLVGPRNVISDRIAAREFAGMIERNIDRPVEVATRAEPDFFALVESSSLDDRESRADGFEPSETFRDELESWIRDAVERVRADHGGGA